MMNGTSPGSSINCLGVTLDVVYSPSMAKDEPFKFLQMNKVVGRPHLRMGGSTIFYFDLPIGSVEASAVSIPDGGALPVGVSQDESVLIGRDPSRCQLNIPFKSAQGPLCSRTHCVFFVGQVKNSPMLCLTDLGSLNGTFVNRKRVLKHEVVILAEGDSIELGAGASVDPNDRSALLPETSLFFAIKIVNIRKPHPPPQPAAVQVQEPILDGSNHTPNPQSSPQLLQNTRTLSPDLGDVFALLPADKDQQQQPIRIKRATVVQVEDSQVSVIGDQKGKTKPTTTENNTVSKAQESILLSNVLGKNVEVHEQQQKKPRAQRAKKQAKKLDVNQMLEDFLADDDALAPTEDYPIKSKAATNPVEAIAQHQLRLLQRLQNAEGSTAHRQRQLARANDSIADLLLGPNSHVDSNPSMLCSPEDFLSQKHEAVTGLPFCTADKAGGEGDNYSEEINGEQDIIPYPGSFGCIATGANGSSGSAVLVEASFAEQLGASRSSIGPKMLLPSSHHHQQGPSSCSFVLPGSQRVIDAEEPEVVKQILASQSNLPAIGTAASWNCVVDVALMDEEDEANAPPPQPPSLKNSKAFAVDQGNTILPDVMQKENVKKNECDDFFISQAAITSRRNQPTTSKGEVSETEAQAKKPPAEKAKAKQPPKKRGPTYQAISGAAQRRQRFSAALDAIDRSVTISSVTAKRRVEIAPQPLLDIPEGPIDLSSRINPGCEPEVYLSEELHSLLRPHQVDGIRFMWRLTVTATTCTASGGPTSNRFLPPEGTPSMTAALTSHKNKKNGHSVSNPAEKTSSTASACGCIIAHAMSLGKTFTSLAFLFTWWKSLPMLSPAVAPRGGKVIVVMPKSVILHWVHELVSWGEAANEDPVTIYALMDELKEKLPLICEWGNLDNHRTVLFLSHHAFTIVMQSAQTMSKKPLNDEVVTEAQPQTDREKLAEEMKLLSQTDTSKKKKGGRRVEKRDRSPAIESKPPPPQKDADSSSSSSDDENEKELIASGQNNRTTAEMFAEARRLLISSTAIVIVDEAHKLGRGRRSLGHALAQLHPETKRIALTGTPDIKRATYIETSNCQQQHQLGLLPVLQFVQPQLWARRDLSDVLLLAELRHALQKKPLKIVADMLPGLHIVTIVTRLSAVQRHAYGELVLSADMKGGVVWPRQMTVLANKAAMITSHVAVARSWYETRCGRDNLQIAWAEGLKDLPSPPAFESLQLSPKMFLAVYLIREALAAGEKVVMFSQSNKLLRIAAAYLIEFGLNFATDFVLIDGTTPATQRHSIAAHFNNPDNDCRVVLAAALSCGAGLSFIGASRLILFEPQWSRQREAQTICRMYRVGQPRFCTVYRLISDTALEQWQGYFPEPNAKEEPISTAYTKRQLLCHRFGAVGGSGEENDENRPQEEEEGLAVPLQLEGDEVTCSALVASAQMVGSVDIENTEHWLEEMI